MTICVAIQVNDGLVYAADSAVTLSYGVDASGKEIINVLPHGNKVFNLHRNLPICAMTCGLGNIGDESITSLAKDIRIQLMDDRSPYAVNPTKYTIEEIATKARQFLFDEKFAAIATKPTPHLSFYVGGYSTDAVSAEQWLVKIESDKNQSPPPQQLRTPGTSGLNWGGQPEAIYRLVMGLSMNYDQALTAAGIDKAVSAPVIQALNGGLQAQIVHPAMPIQDAIDLADFLVDTTKRFVRFLPGADTVGGDTDIAVVTKHEGFKWVRRKHFFSPVLNPAEVSYGKR